jgi:peptide-methionine (S)-S-oxide reductase
VDGVIDVKPGYAGGHVKNPTYKEICTGNTGHAEVARVEFDPELISYDQILNVFWQAHDPTTVNRQGNDVGIQYRSVIFYHSESQKETAEKSKVEAGKSGYWTEPVVTEITELNNYSEAEDYHNNYYNDNPNQPYCMFVIKPKLDKLEKRGIID